MLRHPSDRYLSVGQQQIGFSAFEMFGGSSQDFGAHLLRGGMDSVAGHHCGAAGEGADAPMELVGVAGHHVDVGDGDADLVSDDLGEAGEMALPLGADAGCEQQSAVILDLDSGAS